MSWPTVPSRIPRTIIARLPLWPSAASAIDASNPSTTSEKYSAGPN